MKRRRKSIDGRNRQSLTVRLKKKKIELIGRGPIAIVGCLIVRTK